MKSLIIFFFIASNALSPLAAARELLIVGHDFLPYQGVDSEGKPFGAFVELWKATCERLKYQCKFEVVPRARGVKMMTDGEAQIYSTLAKNPEFDAFTREYVMISKVGYTFFVKKGQADKFNKIQDLKGQSVGVLRGSTMNKDLNEKNKKIGGVVTIVEETLAETPLRKLEAGRYGDGGAVYGTRPVLLFQAKKEKLAVEPVGFNTEEMGHASLIGKKIDEAEAGKIKTALLAAIRSSEIKKVFADYSVPIHPDAQ